jgi:hypothetical protein
MALIEKLDELLEAARRKARTELARNAEVGQGVRGRAAGLVGGCARC